jgi:hypothetical protein
MTTVMDHAAETVSQATSPAPIATFTDEYRCPRCQGLIASSAMRRVPPAPGLGKSGFGLEAYCEHCDAGFVADCGYQDGRIVQYGPTSLLMGASIAELRKHVSQMAGERVVLLDDETDERFERAARCLADLGEIKRRIVGAKAHLSALEQRREQIVAAMKTMQRHDQVKSEIAAGTYEDENKIDATADAILDAIDNGKDYVTLRE